MANNAYNLPPPNTLPDRSTFAMPYVEATNHTVARPPGVVDHRIAAEWGTGVVDPTNRKFDVAPPPDTYHARSVFNPVEWTGHRNLRGGALLHRGAQHIGLISGSPESNPVARVGRTIRNLGGLAAGTWLALSRGMDYLPDNVRDNIHEFTHENPVKTAVAAAALGAFAVGRVLRGLPDRARDAIGGAPGTPLRPGWARLWGREARIELTDNTQSWGRRIGMGMRAAAIGVATQVVGVPIAAFRRTVRR